MNETRSSAVDYHAAITETLEEMKEMDGHYQSLFSGAELSLAAIHLKKHSTFSIGTPDAHYALVVVAGQGSLLTAGDRPTVVPNEDTEDEDEDDEDEDDEDEDEDEDGPKPVKLREDDVAVLSGAAELRTKGHGLRLLIIAPVHHSLLPALV